VGKIESWDMTNLFEIFLVFLKLGLTSFGGPIAHLGYFHDEFVVRKKWLSDSAYADLVALCQFLPGPASSQVGISIGLSRAGIPGAIAAWLGFTLPSAILLILFGLGISHFSEGISPYLLLGLKIVAVIVVSFAVWKMARKLCPDKERASIAIASALSVIAFSSVWIQIGVIFFGGIIGWLFLKSTSQLPHTPLSSTLTKKAGVIFLSVFFGLLLALPIAAQNSELQSLKYFDSFFRAGSLVFGGGHVVMPLLHSEVVPAGWVTHENFMAGYGAAQAVPGPLFTFSAFLGAVSQGEPSGWLGGVLCLIAIFLPSFLLVFGALPFWEQLRTHQSMRNAMLGINAAVVGLLGAALYNALLDLF
jgi:chromate transporter